MARLLRGAFISLSMASFTLSWAYAFSGMFWPAQVLNALAVAQVAFYVMWMRPRRHLDPGHICCYLGPVHVPKFVYDAWDAAADHLARVRHDSNEER